MRAFIVINLLFLMLTSCIHPKVKYRKQALLDPLMQGRSSMSESMMANEATIGVEKGGLSGSDGSLGSNCPTCG